MASINVRVTREQERAIKRVARQRGVTVSDLVREIAAPQTEPERGEREGNVPATTRRA